MNANTNKISNKKLLNDYFKSLPDNEVDKGKKVKLINAFLVNNLYDHEWFRQIVKNGSTLIQVSQYYNINIQIINNLFAIDIRYQNDLFCEYLYEVITYHDYINNYKNRHEKISQFYGNKIGRAHV